MKRSRFLLALLLSSALVPLLAVGGEETPGHKTRVLLITGGHEFEREPFFKLFQDNPDITFQAVEEPKAQALFSAKAAADYDVIVLYDFYQPISEEAKANFVARLKDGKGLVVLHHAIADYQDWPEYRKIIGARYYLEPTVVDGVEKARSAYQHGVHFKIHVVDSSNPVTRGMSDFEVVDETYKLFDVAPDVHPLLTTDEPLSNPVIAWWKTYGAARVVYIQSGHDHVTYQNPNYRQLVRQAIAWAAKKD